jgi:hypothetical protein
VIGFRVDLKPEFKSTTERWDQTFLQYGSNGTRGAMASYLAQTCSNEELDLDLDKKTSSSNWAYQDLSEAYFQQPVSSWSYCNAVGFSSYRFRFEFEDDCSTTLTTAQRISWAWMTTTSCP